MRTVTLAILVLLSVLLAGCGGEERPSLREYCMGTGQAFCGRSASCGLLDSSMPTEAACLTVFMKGCCQDSGTCNDEGRIDDEQLARCIDGVAALDCASISQGAVAAACME